MKIKRRDFITATAGTAVAAALPKISRASAQYKWNLCTTWPPKMPILQESVDMFAKEVAVASDNRLKIKVFAGGELIPPLEVFGSVSQGLVQMGVGAPYYWAGKAPAAQFFGAIPFGLNAQQFNAWMVAGGGQQLWEELYASFNLIPLCFGNTGVQMGGWFKKPISGVSDLKGLKIRMPGLGGRALAAAGANVVLMPGSEIYTALERGTIDATEWISPFHDERMGLYRAAKNYYYPGWHEPQANLELTINKAAWEKLPPDLQAIVRHCAAKISAWAFYKSEAENGPSLYRLVNEKSVKVIKFPNDILKLLRKTSNEVVDDLAGKDAFSKKVYDSYSKFAIRAREWSKVSEVAYSHHYKSR